MMSELTVLKKCSHTNIMDVTEILEDEDNYYIASELLHGGELFEAIKSRKFNQQQSATILK
jgi:serine/threonine protein kinase